MFRFYWRLLKDVPSHWREIVEGADFWAGLVLTGAIGLLSPVWVTRINTAWEGSRWWALLLAIAWVLLRINFLAFKRRDDTTASEIARLAQRVAELEAFPTEKANVLAEFCLRWKRRLIDPLHSTEQQCTQFLVLADSFRAQVNQQIEPLLTAPERNRTFEVRVGIPVAGPPEEMRRAMRAVTEIRAFITVYEEIIAANERR